MRNNVWLDSVIVLLLLLIVVLQFSCGNKNDKGKELSDEYVKELMNERSEKDRAFRNESYSPFTRAPKVKFHPLNYYDLNPDFIFRSKLYEYDKKDTVVVYGTKGEPRQVIVFGYLTLNYEGTDYDVNLYKSETKDGKVYYSIWFTDKTTGTETYGVGRYLDFEKVGDLNHIYTIDFNRAYNPYCAYNSVYTCAIPRKEDYINLEITAGEKKFH